MAAAIPPTLPSSAGHLTRTAIWSKAPEASFPNGAR
jgi:hypothetical protein